MTFGTSSPFCSLSLPAHGHVFTFHEGWFWPNGTNKELSSCIKQPAWQIYLFGKMTTWPEDVMEATTATRDTTVSISCGTCRGEHRGGRTSLVVAIPRPQSGQDHHFGLARAIQTPLLDCPEQNKPPHLQNCVPKVLLPTQHLQDVLVEFHFHPGAFDKERAQVPQDEGDVLPLPQALGHEGHGASDAALSFLTGHAGVRRHLGTSQGLQLLVGWKSTREGWR